MFQTRERFCLRLRYIFIVGFVCVFSVQTVTAQDYFEKVINNYISKQAEEYTAVEYEDAKKIVFGDVNGDGIKDIVVLYTLEGFDGGNNYGQYLAVFIKLKNGKLKYITDDGVGGKNSRAVWLVSIKNNKILLNTKEYADSDGSCCPSIKRKTQYVLLKNKLKEVNLTK